MQVLKAKINEQDSIVACASAAGLTIGPETISFYLSTPEAQLLVAKVDGQVVGSGVAIRYGGQSGWIGGLSAHPSWQGRGVGTAVLEASMQWLLGQGIESISVMATAAGGPVYEKMGFRMGSGAFRHYTGEGMSWTRRDDRIRPLMPFDWEKVERLDKAATGEKRGLLLRSLRNGYVMIDRAGTITGYHLRAPWGGGPAVGPDAETGRLLFDLVRGLSGAVPLRVVIPEENKAAVEYMATQGFIGAQQVSHHMVIGPELPPYRPERVWSVFNMAMG